MSAAQSFQVVLNTSREQFDRLRQLQVTFAAVCNALSPIVNENRCWNRVALHHLAYRQMRDLYPELGSQMVCNAIYAVCKTARVVYQHPDSPFNVKRVGDQKLAVIRFVDVCPVYFDRHTLTLDGEKLSMYTLDGRLKFMLTLTERQRDAFKLFKLGEISLHMTQHNLFALTFKFKDSEVDAALKPEQPLPYSVAENQAYVTPHTTSLQGERP